MKKEKIESKKPVGRPKLPYKVKFFNIRIKADRAKEFEVLVENFKKTY